MIIAIILGTITILITIGIVIASPKKEDVSVKVAFVGDYAYWQEKGEWFKAPADIEAHEIDMENKEKIDIFTTDSEEVNLLLQIVESFEN